MYHQTDDIITFWEAQCNPETEHLYQSKTAALLTTKVTRMRRLNVQTLAGALDMIETSIKNDSLENSKRVDFEEPAIFSNTATINNLPKDIDDYLSAIEYLRAKHKRVLKPIEFIDFSN